MRERQAYRKSSIGGDLHFISMAMIGYTKTHGGAYPPSLSVLRKWAGNLSSLDDRALSRFVYLNPPRECSFLRQGGIRREKVVVYYLFPDDEALVLIEDGAVLGCSMLRPPATEEP